MTTNGRQMSLNLLVSRFITVRGDYVGFHAYENAPDEVAFLRNNHRHKFYWEAKIQVLHDDRELEFFIVKNMIETEIIPFTTMQQNLGSCEMQAERILEGLVNAYGDKRTYIVAVSEDNESDGFVIYDPTH